MKTMHINYHVFLGQNVGILASFSFFKLHWHSESEVLAEIAKYADLIVSDETDLAGKTDAEKAEALIVSSSTTRFDIRAQLEKGLKNDKYMLSITSFTRTAATDKANGFITFNYRLVTKDYQGAELLTPITVTIKKGN